MISNKLVTQVLHEALVVVYSGGGGVDTETGPFPHPGSQRRCPLHEPLQQDVSLSQPHISHP